MTTNNNKKRFKEKSSIVMNNNVFNNAAAYSEIEKKINDLLNEKIHYEEKIFVMDYQTTL